MRVDHHLEAGSGISVTAAPAADNPTVIIQVESLGKQVVSPEGPLVILDNIGFSIANALESRLSGAPFTVSAGLLYTQLCRITDFVRAFAPPW